MNELGLVLPEDIAKLDGMKLPFPKVRILGDRAIISGHGPQEPDGSMAAPFGKVGVDVSVEEAAVLAQKTGLSILGSLKRALGDLDRIAAWVRVFGMVNAAPDFTRHPLVINGFSEMILEVFGDEVGRHARSAVGMGSLPMNIAVEIEAEVLIRP